MRIQKCASHLGVAAIPAQPGIAKHKNVHECIGIIVYLEPPKKRRAREHMNPCTKVHTKKLPNSHQEVHVRKRAPAGGKVGAELGESDSLRTCDRKPRPAHPSGRPSERNVDTPEI